MGEGQGPESVLGAALAVWNWAGNWGYDEGTGDREAEVARL